MEKFIIVENLTFLFYCFENSHVMKWYLIIEHLIKIRARVISHMKTEVVWNENVNSWWISMPNYKRYHDKSGSVDRRCTFEIVWCISLWRATLEYFRDIHMKRMLWNLGSKIITRRRWRIICWKIEPSSRTGHWNPWSTTFCLTNASRQRSYLVNFYHSKFSLDDHMWSGNRNQQSQ